MSQFIVPNIFTAGTKAKAYEVNENFAAVKDKLNDQQTLINTNTTGLSNLQTYVDGDLKDEFTTLIKNNKTKFCVNSAYSPILKINTEDTSELLFNVDDGTTYKKLVATYFDGTSFERTSLSALDMSSLANGTYNIFAGATGDPYALLNTIYKQKTEPATPINGDVWLNTSVEPLEAEKYNGEDEQWEVFNDVPLGKAIVASGVITSVTQPQLNQNGYDFNYDSLTNEKSNITNWVMPDLDNGVSKAWNTQYSADTNGWVYVNGGMSGQVSGTAKLIVGAAQELIIFRQNTDEGGAAGMFVPIPKGRGYKATGGTTWQIIKWYPCIGG